MVLTSGRDPAGGRAYVPGVRPGLRHRTGTGLRGCPAWWNCAAGPGAAPWTNPGPRLDSCTAPATGPTGRLAPRGSGGRLAAGGSAPEVEADNALGTSPG
ncbi:hypothetical protein SCA03_06480 [Streptomyces cacaoi]|uniref:Uncharacterized protein n=1 Tax=Streptomyces cacaoi TaxID=1898 RepID=A0A4Y3QTU2_STRCI|nr:hypothetical protein SCA03_06480 [Streptomyces cacaoi]